MITLDASALIAVTRPSDAHYAASVQLFATMGAPRFWLHPVTLAETLVGPTRDGTEGVAVRTYERLGMQVVDFDIRVAPLRLAQLRVTTRLRLSDCCVLDAARESSTPLVSFDDDLRAAAQVLGLTVLP